MLIIRPEYPCIHSWFIEGLDGYMAVPMLCQLRANLWEADATNGIINGSDDAQLAVFGTYFVV